MRSALVHPPAPLRRLIAALALALAAAPVVVYLWLAAHRLDYRYELDWLEGGTVELVGRVLHGQSLYAAPTLSYVGFTYTPLFFWVSALLAKIIGLGFLPLRIVAVAGSLLGLGSLGLYVGRVSRDWIAGALAVGLFAGCYGLTGDFFDIGRADSMYVGLSLLALWLGRRLVLDRGGGVPASAVRGGLLAGAVAFLAFFTKQTGLIAVGPALVVLALLRPRAGLSALALLLVAGGVSTLVLDALTHHWYLYFIDQELAGQPPQAIERLDFWTVDLYENLHPLTWLIVLGGVSLLAGAGWRRGRGSWTLERLRTPWLYDLAAVIGLLIAAWVSRIHSGGYLNVLMPAYAAAAGLGGGAVAALRRRGWLIGLVGIALVALQLHGLLKHPSSALPTAQDRQAGRTLLAELRALPGPVLLLRHPYYATEVGKGTFAQSDGIAEVLRSTGPRGAADLRRALAGSLNRDHIQAVILDNGQTPPSWLAPQLSADFRIASRHFLVPKLRPPSDIGSSPTTLYLRRRG